MKDVMNTRHHAVIRTTGKEFSVQPGFEPSSSSRKYPENIEKPVDERMKKLKVCTMPMIFGRKEVEEHILRKCWR